MSYLKKENREVGAQRREKSQKVVGNGNSTKVREEIKVEKKRRKKEEALNTHLRKAEMQETQRSC